MHETRQNGFDVLSESLHRTPLALGPGKFEWMITYNGEGSHAYMYLQDLAAQAPVKVTVVWQRKEDCPLPLNNPLGMWKACPPRLSPHTHEIICDNDIVFLKSLPHIAKFLDSPNRSLLLAEPVRYFGKLDALHPRGEKWNSGLLGLPPGYDFGKAIRDEYQGAVQRCLDVSRFEYAEEQSLLTACMKRLNPIVVGVNDIVEMHRDGRAREPNEPKPQPHQYGGQEYGVHFTQINRSDDHIEWNRYRQWQRLHSPGIPVLPGS